MDLTSPFPRVPLVEGRMHSRPFAVSERFSYRSGKVGGEILLVLAEQWKLNDVHAKSSRIGALEGGCEVDFFEGEVEVTFFQSARSP